MEWRGRRQSSNIEDRRGGGFGGGMRMPGGFGGRGGGFRIPMGRSSGGRMGGGSIVTLVIVLGILWMAGINPLQLLGSMSDGGGGPAGSTIERPNVAGRTTPPRDEAGQFVATVLADTEDVWSRIFAANGETYQKPTLVLFENQTQSGCGFASAATGPFYCPVDRKVYIDLAFYDELRRRFEAPGDFAQAYVLAHEVGHHVQNLTGILPRFEAARQRMSETEANAYSVRVELQADCYAGIWAHDTEQQGFVEAGDIDEALNAATQIGDDAIQKRMQGYVVPETFNHGTSEQRRSWFRRGYQSGDPQQCDTINADGV